MGEHRTTKSPTKIGPQPQERGKLNNSNKSNVNSTNSSPISQQERSNKTRSSNANKDGPAASRRQTSTSSHGVKASSELSVSDWVHFIGMMLLYTSQGLVQAVTMLVPLSFLHINKGFSKESIGLIGLPAYAFSFKFVWSPIVDLLWAKRLCPALSETRSDLNNHRTEVSAATVHNNTKKRTQGYGGAGVASLFNIRGLGHRRLQWTVLMQLGICFSLAYLHHLATTSTTLAGDGQGTASIWELIANNMRSPLDVVIALGFLSFFNATQDIAVDAWAVEGLSPAKAKHAGALQFVGLTIGMTIYSIFTSFYTSDSEQYPISIYFTFVGIFCLAGVVVAVLTASLAPLWVEVKPQSASSPDPSVSSSCLSASSSSVLNDVLGFLNTPSVRAVVLYLSTRGFMESSGGLIGIEMMALGWSSTADTATLSIVSTVTQLLTATIITPFILNRVGSFVTNNSGSETKSLTNKGRSRGGRKQGEDATSSASNSTLSALFVMRVAIPLMASVHLFNYVLYTCVALSGARLSTAPVSSPQSGSFVNSQSSSSSFVVDMLGGVDNAKWLYLWLVQVPQTIFLSIVRSSVFMCACTLFAKEASKVANLTGTAVTILNSIANMGYALPASITLLISERLMGLVFGTSGSSEAGGYISLPNTLTPAAFWAVLSGGFSVSVGLLLLILVTIPSIRKLEIDAKREA